MSTVAVPHGYFEYDALDDACDRIEYCTVRSRTVDLFLALPVFHRSKMFT